MSVGNNIHFRHTDGWIFLRKCRKFLTQKMSHAMVELNPRPFEFTPNGLQFGLLGPVICWNTGSGSIDIFVCKVGIWNYMSFSKAQKYVPIKDSDRAAEPIQSWEFTISKRNKGKLESHILRLVKSHRYISRYHGTRVKLRKIIHAFDLCPGYSHSNGEHHPPLRHSKRGLKNRKLWHIITGI